MAYSFDTLIGQFKHRVVRDLAWVIVSPPLVAGTLNDVHWWSYEDCLSEFNDCQSKLSKLDIQPLPLVEHLTQIKNRRLGSIFEGLVSYWLAISPNFRELHQNIQIIEDKHTFGEIDFIIQNIMTKKIIHLEVAVKFYLGSEPYEDAYRWFGTNTKDQLGKKIDHLIKHQTQLSHHYPEKLKNYCPQSIDEKHCFIKGRLFYPNGLEIPPQNLTLAENHLRGRWCYLDQRNHRNNVIKINKSHWLAELNNEDIQCLGISSETSINEIDRAECFVEIEESENVAIEKQRIFYLPKSFTFPS